jgi:putative membrane protein
MSHHHPPISDYPRAERVIRTILPLMYLAGAIGLQYPQTAELFALLTPLNLLSSLVFLLLFHTDWRPTFWAYAALAFLVGFGVEVVGVHTGLIFGSYQYGSVLGVKVAEVPLTIGVNWLLLTYACGSVCDAFRWPVWSKVLAAAGLMTLLDVLIEPVAIRLDFWSWNSPSVPLQNYLAWYVISAFLMIAFYTLPFRKNNRLALLMLAVQFLFFGLSNLLYFADLQ